MQRYLIVLGLSALLLLFGIGCVMKCEECISECTVHQPGVRSCRSHCYALNLPAAPSGLSVSVIDDGRIGSYPQLPTPKLVWQDNSDKEEKFVIEQAQDRFGPWEKIAEVPANVTSFMLHWLPEASPGYYGRWYYRVRAQNTCGVSDPSNVVGARYEPVKRIPTKRPPTASMPTPTPTSAGAKPICTRTSRSACPTATPTTTPLSRRTPTPAPKPTATPTPTLKPPSGIYTPEDMRNYVNELPEELKLMVDEDVVIVFAPPKAVQRRIPVESLHIPSMSVVFHYPCILSGGSTTKLDKNYKSEEGAARLDELLRDEELGRRIHERLAQLHDLATPTPEDKPPSGSGAEIGKAYPFFVLVDCGIRLTLFDGRCWTENPVVDRPCDDENGTMTLVEKDLAVFTTKSGRNYEFIPSLTAAGYCACY